jgi:tetratricopeptide (TPR) repeat protein
MILTQCPVCAASLPALTAKQCSRCKTRYCGPECQKKHWKEGGHKDLCKEIKRGGGAEQYHADKKYEEAVADAVEECADDTKGQTCYICTQALHWKTKEGLVRGCSCRGTAGFAHVSCLMEQAKILCDEAEENNLDTVGVKGRALKWFKCSLCEQNYHGVVLCALGWACWKTYLGRPETERARRDAMNLLGNGLSAGEYHEDALSVREAQVSLARRSNVSEAYMLNIQGNLANSYEQMGRLEETMTLRREIYSGFLKLFGKENWQNLRAACNYASSLHDLQRFEEAKSLMRKTIPLARRVLGKSHDLTLRMRWTYALALYEDDSATLNDLREAVATLEDADQVARRVLGGANPTAEGIEESLQDAQNRLRALKNKD